MWDTKGIRMIHLCGCGLRRKLVRFIAVDSTLWAWMWITMGIRIIRPYGFYPVDADVNYEGNEDNSFVRILVKSLKSVQHCLLNLITPLSFCK